MIFEVRFRNSSSKSRRNPIGNRGISGFNGQKPCTRITLGVLQSFLRFLDAKDINSCLK